MKAFRSARQLAAALIAAGLVMLAPPAQGETLWHHPPDKTVIAGGGILHVLLEASSGDAASVRLKLNDLTVPPESKSTEAADTLFLHYTIRLQEGLNTLEASSQDGLERRDVFYQSAFGAAAMAPRGFTPSEFHRANGEGMHCQGCHDMEAKPADMQPGSPRESTCYSCHASVVAFETVHGPASAWACTRCHEPEATPVRYSTPQRAVSELCYRCHAEMKAYFDEGPYRHGPTAMGQCTLCHDPHGSDNLYALRRPAWTLCTSCHARNASGSHIIAWGPSGNTHPTRGKADPMQPHRELACNSCHNPHAAPTPQLWQFKATSYLQLCLTCHKM